MTSDRLFAIFFLTHAYFISTGHFADVLIKTLTVPRVKRSDSSGRIEFVSADNRTVHRQIRDKSFRCSFPDILDDAQLNCVRGPSGAKCTQTCMFGYTLSEGIQRKMMCNYDENIWTPVNEFETCKPFIDCTLKIKPGGIYNCKYNFMDKGTHCDVSCDHYEDSPEVPKATYKCDINGNWEPKLPFCVGAGSGIKLVPRPKGPKVITEISN